MLNVYCWQPCAVAFLTVLSCTSMVGSQQQVVARLQVAMQACDGSMLHNHLWMMLYSRTTHLMKEDLRRHARTVVHAHSC
jgi:hypothetical protein